MTKKVTLQDIATAAGISKASVSMILNRRGINNFNEETVAKVYKLAAELNYKSVRGQTFRHGKVPNSMIMILVPSYTNPYYTALLQGIEDAAVKHGFLTATRTTYLDIEKERMCLEYAMNHNLGGVIFCMTPQNKDFIYEVNNRMPVVSIGDKREGLQISTVDMNNYAAGRHVTEYLHELGHKNLAFISTSLNEYQISRLRRHKGVKVYCENNDLNLYTYAKGYELFTNSDNKNSEYKSGYELANRCIDECPDVTAMIAVNDMVAYGAYDAIMERGLRIPEDMSLIGFDNVFTSSLAGIGLTSVDNTLQECGSSAFKLLMEQMNSYENEGKFVSFTHMEYRSKIVERKTVGVPRQHPLEPKEREK